MSQDVLISSDSYQQQFQTGLSALQQKNWDVAIKDFQTILDQSPGKSLSADQAGVIYNNMSLAAKQKGEILQAYIWAKKSHQLAPENKAVENNLNSLSPKIEVPLVNHEISTYEHLQKTALRHSSYDVLAILTIAFAFLAAYQFAKFFLARKKANLTLETDEDSDPKKLKVGFPWIGLLSCVLFAFFLILTNLKWLDQNTARGIISSQVADLQTNPGQNQAVILQLKAATEVEVIGRAHEPDGNYIQIRYPGAFSGWVKKSDIVVLSDIP